MTGMSSHNTHTANSPVNSLITAHSSIVGPSQVETITTSCTDHIEQAAPQME